MLAVDREWYLHRDANDRLRSQTLALLEAFHAEQPAARPASRARSCRSRAGHAQERVFGQLLTGPRGRGRRRSERDQVRLAVARDPAERRSAARRRRARGRLSRGRARRRPARRRRWPGTGSRATSGTSSTRSWWPIGASCGCGRASTSTQLALAEIQDALVGYLQANKEIGPSGIKDLLGVSRKYAIPLLEYFDAQRVTVRQGEHRVLRGPSRRWHWARVRASDVARRVWQSRAYVSGRRAADARSGMRAIAPVPR